MELLTGLTVRHDQQTARPLQGEIFLLHFLRIDMGTPPSEASVRRGGDPARLLNGTIAPIVFMTVALTSWM